MKRLVDILARELAEWPKESEKAMQDFDKEIRFFDSVGDQMASFDFYAEELACDACDEKTFAGGGTEVTRAEWKAAVDALNAPKVVEWPSLGETVEVIKGPAEWDDDDRPMIGAEGKVRSVFKNDCDQKIIAIELPSGECKCFIVECIKPARTAEQVAAEEREKAAIDLAFLITGHMDRSKDCAKTIGEIIHDAGYRKEPKQCGS